MSSHIEIHQHICLEPVAAPDLKFRWGRLAFDRQSVNESFYSVVGRAARANFDALTGSGVNAQLRVVCERTHRLRKITGSVNETKSDHPRTNHGTHFPCIFRNGCERAINISSFPLCIHPYKNIFSCIICVPFKNCSWEILCIFMQKCSNVK